MVLRAESMGIPAINLLKKKMDEPNYRKLTAVKNSIVRRFLADATELCEPESIFICTDSQDDIRYIREQAIALGEESPLGINGHTIHFDGMEDQGRDREATKYLVPKTDSLSKTLNQVEREEGLTEIRGLLRGTMKERTMIVRFLSLGPTGSVFSIPCVQCTDSFYVAHSEDLLYRPAYEQFTRIEEKGEIFRILHSVGKMNENMVSVESEKKRIYIDYAQHTIYSVNTQYAGNTVGLKKLALRLTIRKADREGWLAEHMFLMGVHGPNSRKTYFAGAFPSACGKTSTKPNSSASISVSGMPPQLTATNGWSRRRLWLWIARATSSLPVPLSPSTSTVAPLSATVGRSSSNCCILWLWVMMSSSL